jgi:N-acetylglucosamine-6-phosphate deacetylase
MSLIALTGARILSDKGWLEGHALLIEKGLIVSLQSEADVPARAKLEQLNGGTLLPGFIDTQVNGGGGVLFNDKPTVAGIKAIAAAHRKFGTTGMLPTLISDDLSVIATAISAVETAIAQGVPGIVGIHIEGPFLNPDKHGIHDAGKFRTLDDEAITLLSSLRGGKTLVTLAPELAPSGAITALVARGVVVAAGHTLASYEQMQAARAEGLTGITHLFNAMTPLEGRAPGVVGAGLEGDFTCGIIVDGHHVHPASLRAAYRARGAHGLMLVTDAMPTVGSEDHSFTLSGVTIRAKDGALRSEGGTLAGSDLDMASAVRNAVSMMHVDLAAASVMASGTPARFLGIAGSVGQIAAGMRADLVWVDEGQEVQRIWNGGLE